jgi:hypothetical protein
MALQKQNISVPINSNIDTKSDPFLTSNESFLAQENVRFEKAGAITKRDRLFSRPALNQTAHDLVSDGTRLFVCGNAGRSEVQVFNAPWRTLSEEDGVAQAKMRLVDTFGGDGNALSAYMTGSAFQKAIIVDTVQSADNAPAARPVLYITNGDRAAAFKNFTTSSASDIILLPKCAIMNVSPAPVVCASAYYESGASYFLKYAIVSQAGTEIAQNDVAVSGTSITHASLGTNTGAILFYAQGVNTLRAISILPNGTHTVTDITVATNIENVVDVSLDFGSPGSPIHILATQFNGYPVVIGLDSATLALTFEKAESNGTLSLGTLTSASGCGGITSVGNDYHYTYTTVQDATFLTRMNYIKGTGTTSSLENFDNWMIATTRPLFFGSKVFCGLRSRVRSTNNNRIFQSSYVAQINPTSSKQRFSYVAAFNHNSNDELVYDFTGGTIEGDGTISMIDRTLIRNSGRNGALGFATGGESAVELYEIFLGTNRRQQGTALASNKTLVHYAAAPSFFDNISTQKASIIFPIAITSVAAISTAAPGIVPGAYRFKAYFELIDDQGQIIYGQESPAVTFTVPAAPNNAVRITIPLNTSLSGRVRVTVCRTKQAGEVFYVLRRQMVDSSQALFIIDDESPDSFIGASTQLLYTTGGILSASPIPPALHACPHNNRVFVVPADELNRVYYSKTLLENEYPQFSDLLFLEQFSILPFRDKIQAVGSVGDKLIILRESSIYWISGDGANDAGVNPSFSEPELLSSDIGCLDPKSVVKTAVGLFFKSPKGLYMIDNGLGLKYIGDAVESFNPETIHASCSNPTENLVMFLTASRVLVYNYYFGRWSIDTIGNIDSITVNEGTFNICRNNTVARYINNDSADSAGLNTVNIMKVITGWLKLSGLQDFARVYRLLILGRRIANHALTVKVYYDYDDTIVETFTIAPDPAQGIYQFKLHLRRQKCQAIKIEIADDGGGRKCELTGITLEVGMKRGSAKINTARQY